MLNVARTLRLTLTLGLVLQILSPVVVSADLQLLQVVPQAAQSDLLYRAEVTVAHATDQQLLDIHNVHQLAQDGETVIVVVDATQLEVLAQAGLRPRQINELSHLAQTHRAEHPQLARALQPLLDEASALERQATGDTALELSGLHATVAALGDDDKRLLARVVSADADGDGLTDQEEFFWCTDPNNPNSDFDAEGYTDGEEVAALLNPELPRQVRYGYGAPFGPPNVWPDFNNMDGDPSTPACNDGDRDTIPDLAEAQMIGSRVPAESTDGDKFDDGQELFGVTFCPGGSANCGYGSYPRSVDSDFITEQMPLWVEPPGDSIFVAAFPQPEISVIPNSWTVERVTTITTEEGEMTQQTNSYQTAVTTGQSSSVSETETWNEWEEVSRAVERPSDERTTTQDSMRAISTQCSGDFWKKASCIGTNSALLLLGTAGEVAAGLPCGASVSFEDDRRRNGSEVGIGFSLPCPTILQVAQSTSQAVSESAMSVLFPDDVQYFRDQQATGVTTQAGSQFPGMLTGGQSNFDYQGIALGLDGVNYTLNQQNQILASSLHDISYQLARPRLTTTNTSGSSRGGAHTVTHEEYEEHTVTEGQAFTTGTNWSTATAVNSAHAADLNFDYTILNAGTEFAREITGVIFNVYLGDDETPLVSYPAWQQFPSGKLSNVYPGESHTFTTDPIPLSLEEMRRIDLGDRLRVELEDFSFGADEQYYQNAANSGVTVLLDDGVDDNDASVDSYILAAWGNNSLQRVLTRYFDRTEDADGNLLSLSTPEFDGTNPPVFNEYVLSETAWWNVYQTCSSDCATVGATPLYEQIGQQGSAVLMRFNRDTDRDGYKDSVELRYGTDKADPADHPQPDIVAGYVSSREGDTVTTLLKVGNFGTFDGYGIDAVMIAADDTISIGNNTVGGNGRVRPNSQVAVGSLILPPQLDDWQGTADPYAIGNYTGDSDKVFTFTVGTAGVVGQGGTTLDWSDGAANGTLALGSSYGAPLPVTVADGLAVGFDTGTMLNGDSFTVETLTPRDTFTYTVNSEPHTPPIIVVSYSDPQGSRKFVTPVELGSLDADLTAHGGAMLPDIGLQIVTRDELASSGNNTTDFILNNPQPLPLTDAKLYLNFVSDGELVQEVPITLTVPAGPTVQSVEWSVDDFDAAYNPDGDNILLAFWTDYEGNIIDSAARPFDTFQDDPTAQLALAQHGATRSSTFGRSRTSDLTWAFGTVTQGELVHETVTLGNVGRAPLRVYVDGMDGLTAAGLGLDAVGAADTRTLDLMLDTSGLATGAFTGTATIRTSDRSQPLTMIAVSGTITTPTEEAVARPVIDRPLDVSLSIPGSHSAGEWIQYTHPLGPNTQTIHPVYVRSVDDGSLGVGEYATNFGEGTSSAEMFGDGRDGIMPSSGNLDQDNGFAAGTVSGSAGSTDITITDRHNVSRINPGDKVLIHQTIGSGAGNWEINEAISDIESETSTYTFASPLVHDYSSSGNNRAQILRIPQYTTCDVNGTATPLSVWNGTWGGIFAVLCQQPLSGSGTITASGYGYRGGVGQGVSAGGQNGESANGYLGRGGSANGGTGSYGGGSGSTNDSSSPSGISMGGAGSGGYNHSGGQGDEGTGGGGGGGHITAGGGGGGGADSNTGGGTGGTAGSNNGGGNGGTASSSSRNGGNGGQRPYRYTGTGGKSWNSPDRGSGGGGGGSSVRLNSWGQILLGSGGGASGAYKGRNTSHSVGRNGGSGGGIVFIASPSISQNVVVQANGESGSSASGRAGAGGGGAAGTILIRTESLSLMTNTISANGGNGGGRSGAAGGGGQGGIGRIRIEYCESLTGTTSPAANTEKLDCYIAEQANDDTHTRLNLPEATSSGTLLTMQYGRLVEFGATGEFTTTLRVPDAAFGAVTLDALVSGHSGSFNLKLDIGNDGSWDWQPSGDGQAQTLNSPDLTAAFNAYRATQPSGSSGYLDVPVRVALDQAGQILLANMVVERVNSVELTLDSLTAPSAAAAGSVVTLSADVTNSSSETVIGATVSFVTTLPDGQDWFLGSAFIDQLDPNSMTQATLSWNTTSFTGTLPIRAYVDPYNHFVESNEDDNEATATIEIDSTVPTAVTLLQNQSYPTASVMITVMGLITFALLAVLLRTRKWGEEVL